MAKQKKLYRSRKDVMVGGVCAGIAEYYGVDPLAIRLVTLVFALSGGTGIVAYFILWWLVPENPKQKRTA